MPNNDEKKVLLKVTDLKQWFPLKKTKLFQKEQEYVRANDGITLNITAELLPIWHRFM